MSTFGELYTCAMHYVPVLSYDLSTVIIYWGSKILHIYVGVMPLRTLRISGDHAGRSINIT